MKEQMKYVVFMDILLIFISIFSLLCPLIKIVDLRRILLVLYISFGFISAFKFLLKKVFNDFETMYQTIAALVFSLIFYYINLDSVKKLALLFTIWIFTMSLTKLIKCDYYHDHKNPLWISKAISVLIFIIIGLVCSVSFSQGKIIIIIMISFNFLLSNIIDLMHDLFESLVEIK